MIYRILGKVRKRKPEQDAVWRHNGLLGEVRRAEIAMRNVQCLETTTDESRKLARKIERDITNLYILIHTRRDQEKSGG